MIEEPHENQAKADVASSLNVVIYLFIYHLCVNLYRTIENAANHK